jgi:hypothetical protein
VKRIIVMALSVILALTMAASAAFAQSDNAPQPVDETPFLIEANDPRFPGACPFPVELVQSGKSKEIVRPNGDVLTTSPGLDATLTNVNTGEQVTFNITGTVLRTTLENGDVKTVFRGRNLGIDPKAGMVIAIGRFTFVFSGSTLVQPLKGKGRLIDVCEVLAPAS